MACHRVPVDALPTAMAILAADAAVVAVMAVATVDAVTAVATVATIVATAAASVAAGAPLVGYARPPDFAARYYGLRGGASVR